MFISELDFLHFICMYYSLFAGPSRPSKRVSTLLPGPIVVQPSRNKCVLLFFFSLGLAQRLSFGVVLCWDLRYLLPLNFS
jgi:hypothetical protein